MLVLHLYFLYLCTIRNDKKSTLPREKIYSPTGEIKKLSEWAQMAVGFDKEDGGGS